MNRRVVIALCTAGLGALFVACESRLVSPGQAPHREAASSLDHPALAVKLPARFRHNRLFLRPLTSDGDQIEFYTDTGGGWNAIRRSDSERLGLNAGAPVRGDNRIYDTVDFPNFDLSHTVPKPNPAYWLNGRLAVVEDEEIDTAGFLGSRWFADRMWEIDYVEKTFSLLEEVTGGPDASSVDLAFKTNTDGSRSMHFPRLTIHVDSEPIDVLLDTGATAELTATAAAQLGFEENTRIGTSYIIQSIFDRWLKEHPDWLVIPNADSVTGYAFPMIRVPTIQIGEVKTGPVWFTARPDQALEEMMSQMMDKPIAGAIGGSALRYCRLVLDYPGARAHLSCELR